MAEAGRAPWRLPGPAGRPGLDGVQVGFEDLQGRRLHSPSGQPVPALCHLHSTGAFPHVPRGLPLSQFASSPVAGHR